MMKYEKLVDDLTATETIVRNNENGSQTFLPLDPANSDYQSYLRWLNGEEEPSGTL